MPTVFVAGYTDLTTTEFQTHYQSHLDSAIARHGYLFFLLSHEPGTCSKALAYLVSKNVPKDDITIYKDPKDTGNPFSVRTDGTIIVKSPGGELGVYSGMAKQSDEIIVWLREEDRMETWDCKVDDAEKLKALRFKGPKEAKRIWEVRRLTGGSKKISKKFDDMW